MFCAVIVCATKHSAIDYNKERKKGGVWIHNKPFLPSSPPTPLSPRNKILATPLTHPVAASHDFLSEGSDSTFVAFFQVLLEQNTCTERFDNYWQWNAQWYASRSDTLETSGACLVWYDNDIQYTTKCLIKSKAAMLFCLKWLVYLKSKVSGSSTYCAPISAREKSLREQEDRHRRATE